MKNCSVNSFNNQNILCPWKFMMYLRIIKTLRSSKDSLTQPFPAPTPHPSSGSIGIHKAVRETLLYVIEKSEVMACLTIHRASVSLCSTFSVKTAVHQPAWSPFGLDLPRSTTIDNSISETIAFPGKLLLWNYSISHSKMQHLHYFYIYILSACISEDTCQKLCLICTLV